MITSDETRFLFSRTQRVVRFSNNRGASVVCYPQSYGGDTGLFEITVLDAKGNIDYTTPVANDVLGFLSKQGVENVLKQIDALPALM